MNKMKFIAELVNNDVFNGLSDRAFRLVIVLQQWHNSEYNSAFPAREVLLKKLNCSKKSLMKAIYELVNWGVIEYTPGSGRKNSAYKINSLQIVETVKRNPLESVQRNPGEGVQYTPPEEVKQGFSTGLQPAVTETQRPPYKIIYKIKNKIINNDEKIEVIKMTKEELENLDSMQFINWTKSKGCNPISIKTLLNNYPRKLDWMRACIDYFDNKFDNLEIVKSMIGKAIREWEFGTQIKAMKQQQADDDARKKKIERLRSIEKALRS